MKKYDFALTWVNSAEEKFVQWLARECKLHRMSMFVCGQDNTRFVVRDIEDGNLRIKFLLDNEANYGDPIDIFGRLCYAVKDTGGYVLCDPDYARSASNKSITHYDLIRAGINVPYTIVVRNWQPDTFKLSTQEKSRLGEEFIIKPATGFGQRGVIKDAKGSIVEIASARNFNRGDNFLLQQKITPEIFGNKAAWFRVYYLFGEVIPCWWDPQNGRYSHVTPKEFYVYKLLPLMRIVSEIARITRLEFFTSEIAASRVSAKAIKFIAIDYVNDQPELCVRPHMINGPLPDVTEHIAQRCVDTAWRLINNHPVLFYRALTLAKLNLIDETA
jgi:hypothetical protein